jgi:Mg-chelatase subunit ChlD
VAGLLAAVLAAFLSGCGSDEYNPGPAGATAVEQQETPDLAFRDLNDVARTLLTLTTSQSYDAANNTVDVFGLVLDQTGTFFQNLNQYNFSVVVEPKIAPKAIPAEDTTLSLTVSDDRVVALVIDSSGSMSSTTETGESRMEVAKDAANLFVDLMAGGDQTAIVDFDSDARIAQALTDDTAKLKAAIATFSADGATNLGGALTEAVRAVGTRPGKRAAILLTDGDDTVDTVAGGPDVWLNDPSSTRLQGLNLARENNLVVYTVGLGTDLSETGVADLQTFATETGGTFFQAPTASALNTAFGVTIPAELDTQAPMETYLLTIPNLVPALQGRGMNVPIRISVRYENGTGVLFAKFDGTYTVE